MPRNNDSRFRAGRLAAIFAGTFFAFFLASCAASQSGDQYQSADVASARELLDSWSGQSEILDQAREKLTRALESNPQNYLAQKEMARYQIMSGYISSRPTSYKTQIISIGNFDPGTLERAETTIRDAIRINPRFAEGYVLLSHIQFHQMNLDGAAESLKQAEAIGTDDPWLHLNWADIHYANGDDSAAEERWRRVLQSGTRNVKARSSAYGFLIGSYVESGSHDKAVALYEEQIRLKPADAWLRGGFAEYLSQTLGRHDEAITQARAALNIMDYGVGRRILGMALYRKWAEMTALDASAVGAERYFLEAQEIYPQLNAVMVYGASAPGGERLTNALVTRKSVSIDARVEDGSTALLVATNRNRAEIVQRLLKLNADPNIADNSGWTPLLSAADEGNDEIVSVLLERGADTRATLQGASAATLAARKGYTELSERLEDAATKMK